MSAEKMREGRMTRQMDSLVDRMECSGSERMRGEECGGRGRPKGAKYRFIRLAGRGKGPEPDERVNRYNWIMHEYVT